MLPMWMGARWRTMEDMQNHLHLALAQAHSDELLARAADFHRIDRWAVSRPPARGAPGPADVDAVLALRLAGPDEHGAVRRLSALDSVAPLRGDILLALLDGEPVAALSLTDGRGAADPFRASAGALDLLRVRAAGLVAPAHAGRRWRGRALLARLAG